MAGRGRRPLIHHQSSIGSIHVEHSTEVSRVPQNLWITGGVAKKLPEIADATLLNEDVVALSSRRRCQCWFNRQVPALLPRLDSIPQGCPIRLVHLDDACSHIKARSGHRAIAAIDSRLSKWLGTKEKRTKNNQRCQWHSDYRPTNHAILPRNRFEERIQGVGVAGGQPAIRPVSGPSRNSV